MKYVLSLDIEDFSLIDVKYGVHKRAEQGEIILLAYSLDYAPPVVIDLTCETVPVWLLRALTDPDYKKKAYNAPYERAYLNKFFDIYTPPEQWECTLVRAAMCGLPMSLDDSSKALGLIEKKDPIGKALIRYFCIPCKPTAANGMRTRNLPEHDPEKWAQFKQYNIQDVVVEQEVDKACTWYTIPAQEHHLWCLNERKNERGVMVDLELIDAAMALDKTYREELTEEAIELTGLANVNSPTQLRKWLEDETDLSIPALRKGDVTKLITEVESPEALRVLQIRQLMAKSSIKKYASMKSAASALDHRVRGMIQYYGANRTGREAGRICQPQNYPRIQEWFDEMLDDTRELVKRGDIDTLHMVFNNLSDILSQLLRTTFVAGPGKELVVLDFSAIEAVVLAAIAGEDWRLKVFAEGGDIYKATASMMFRVAVKAVSKDQRQKAKVSELLCGFGGSVGAMERMNETIEDPKKRIPAKEIPGLIKDWREANPNIVQLWWDTDAAAKNAIRTGQTTSVTKGIMFGMKKGNLLMKLPSGRCLVYQKAHLRKFYIAHIPETKQDKETGDYIVTVKNVKIGEVRNQSYAEYNRYLSRLGLKDDGTKPGIRETVCFWGQNQTTKKWEVIETYGPKFVENCLSADTKVLSLRGKICIFEVTSLDYIWDGLEWVHCDGIVNKGLQQTISISGVRMTPDHKILTENGWKNASSCSGLNRAQSSSPDSGFLRRVKWNEIALERKMRLRNRKSNEFKTFKQRTDPIMRMQTKRKWCKNSRDEQNTNFCGVAFHVRTLQIANSSSLAQLRRPGYYCVRKMENVSGIYGRHGRRISKRINAGQEKCTRELLQGKLSMDNYERASEKQKRKSFYRNTLGFDNNSRGSRTIRNKSINSGLQNSSQLPCQSFIRESGFYEQVYDIINCGPRNRFTVFDKDDQPFIVHNCTQAIARDLLMNGIINIEEAGHEIILSVHDELVAEVEKDEVTLNEIRDLMLTLPAWASGWPVRAEGFIGDYYEK